MRSRPRGALHPTLALAVLAALVVAAPAAPVTATATTQPTAVGGPAAVSGAPALPAAQAETPSRNGTTLAVRLQPDGDARWAVSMTFVLANESDRAAFADLAERFENGDAEVGFDLETFRRATGAANRTVDRSMSVTDPTRNATVVTGPGGTTTGRLTLHFTWTNFATVDGDRLQFGSVFNTTDGTWLPGLASEQTLAILPPPGFGSPVTATVPPQDGVLRWEGPESFEAGDLAATYERSSTPTETPTGTPTGTPTETPTPGPPGGGSLSDLALILGGAAGLILLAAAVVVLARRRPGDDDAGPTPAAEVDGGSPDGGDDGGAAAEVDGGSNGADAAGGAAAAAADESDDELELLSDEERVERLLERNGGRMKQANIVSETGWSNAKVSQLLSAMDEDDRIDKLRIGRENLISLPDEDVTGLDEE
jgi:hypothetical protein